MLLNCGILTADVNDVMAALVKSVEFEVGLDVIRCVDISSLAQDKFSDTHVAHLQLQQKVFLLFDVLSHYAVASLLKRQGVNRYVFRPLHCLFT